MNLLMQTQQYIQQRHVDSARQAIAQVNMEPGDRTFAAALLPKLLTVYQKCDLWISRFTMSKPEKVSNVDYATMEDYCKTEPKNLYKSYCIPPENCDEKGTQAGKKAWRDFKLKAGAELCTKVAGINAIMAENSIDPQSPCDDEFNVALVKYIEEQVEEVKAKCRHPSQLSKKPAPVSLETCAKDGNKAGKEAWNEFKDNAGDDLCGELANSDDLIKENSRSGDTDCDKSFNEKLTAYLENRISKAKEKCASTPKTTTHPQLNYQIEAANYFSNELQVIRSFSGNASICALLCDQNPQCRVASYHGPNATDGWDNICVLRYAVGERHTWQVDIWSWVKP